MQASERVILVDQRERAPEERDKTPHPILWCAFVNPPPELSELFSLGFRDPSLPLDPCPVL